MSFDVIDRFFKLTLDNVYRFVCAALFAIALTSLAQGVSPLRMLERTLAWLAAPSEWISPVEQWVAARADTVFPLAFCLLCLAALFATREDTWTRAGATVLLAATCLLQCWATVPAAGVTLVIAMSAYSVVGGIVALFFSDSIVVPGFWGHAALRVMHLALSTVSAAIAVVGPLGWLLNADAVSKRGSRYEPVHIMIVRR